MREKNYCADCARRTPELTSGQIDEPHRMVKFCSHPASRDGGESRENNGGKEWNNTIMRNRMKQTSSPFAVGYKEYKAVAVKTTAMKRVQLAFRRRVCLVLCETFPLCPDRERFGSTRETWRRILNIIARSVQAATRFHNCHVR